MTKKQNTKKLEKMVLELADVRSYAFTSNLKGTEGNWLTNGHFAYLVDEKDLCFYVAVRDGKLIENGQSCLVATDNLAGYASTENTSSLIEEANEKDLTRVLSYEGESVHVNNKYFTALREAFPSAKVYIKDSGSIILWIDEDEQKLVAVCMPIRK